MALMPPIFVGTVGLPIEVALSFTRPIILAGATLELMAHRGPHRLAMEWDGVLDVARQKVYYTTLVGDLDVVGQYFLHVRLTLASGAKFCGVFSFYVFPL